MPALDLSTLRKALGVARNVGAGEFTVRLGEESFTATLFTAAAAPAPVSEAPSQSSSSSSATTIKSPGVGYFHRVDGAPENGATVKQGAVLATLESLGIETEITAPKDGVLSSFDIEDGAAVEFGQYLGELQ